MLECPNRCLSISIGDDVYCGSCGAKLVPMRKCVHCENRLFESDRFCRKCGKPAVSQSVADQLDRMESEVEGR